MYLQIEKQFKIVNKRQGSLEKDKHGDSRKHIGESNFSQVADFDRIRCLRKFAIEPVNSMEANRQRWLKFAIQNSQTTTSYICLNTGEPKLKIVLWP